MADSEENVANQEIDEKPENPEIETKVDFFLGWPKLSASIAH